MKGAIKFVVLFLTVLGYSQLAGTNLAYAATGLGYFTGQSNSDNGGDFVLPGGTDSNPSIPDSVDSVSELKSFVKDKYNNGNAWEKIGAAYIIQDMRGGKDKYMPSPTDINKWEDSLDALLASGGTIQWNKTFTYCINTMNIKNHTASDSDPNDVAKYDNCTTEDKTIKFIDKDGNLIYALKRRCANPVGDSPGLTEGWILKGHSTVTTPGGATTDSGDPIQPVAPGDSVTFRHSVTNKSIATTASYGWQVEQENGSGGWFTTGLPKKPTATASAGPGEQDPTAAGAINSFTIPPTASAGTKYCQKIMFTYATGPGKDKDYSLAACVIVVTAPPPSASTQCTTSTVSDGGKYTTSSGHQWTSRTHVTVTDSANATGSPTRNKLVDNQIVGGDGTYASNTWTYTPGSKYVTVSIYREMYVHHNPPAVSGWEPQPGTDSTAGSGGPYDCYGATCTISVVGNGPGGVVLAGQPYTVNATITNVGSSYAQLNMYKTLWGTPHPLGLAMSDGSFHPTNFGLWSGQTRSVSFNLTAPSSGSVSISATPIYQNNFSFGTSCSGGGPTYQQFKLTPSATLNRYSNEDPRNITYSTAVSNSAGVAVSSRTISEFYRIPYGGVKTAMPPGVVDTSGPYQPGPNTIASGNYTPTNTQAGDQYCAKIKFVAPQADGTTDAFNAGYISSDGTTIINKSLVDPWDVSSCFVVINRPIFKVYGSGVSSGGDFSVAGASCSGGGILGSWYNKPADGSRYGAGAQLSNIAYGDDKSIVGFASAQTSLHRSPSELAFGNRGLSGPITSDNYSPKLGGKFGSSHCMTPISPPSGVTPINGNTTLPVATINAGENKAVFVNGDVYISGNITYGGSPWNLGNVPSFVLVATGNIYIDPGVTRLDGLYVSQGDNKAIYTCSSTSNHFTFMAANDLYANCKNRLVVYGSFVAHRVNLMRTYGSLRDEAPGASGSCSNAGIVAVGGGGGAAPIGRGGTGVRGGGTGVLFRPIAGGGGVTPPIWAGPPVVPARPTCAAEIFDFSPEMYLSNPAIQPPGNGATRYDAITSLPPVL